MHMQKGEKGKVSAKVKEHVVEGRYDHYKDFTLDPKGYFLIRVNRELGLLEMAHCDNHWKPSFKEPNRIQLVIRGKTPNDVYWEACKRGLVSRLDHAAYLGKELEKAFVALQLGIDYVQDEDLKPPPPA